MYNLNGKTLITSQSTIVLMYPKTAKSSVKIRKCLNCALNAVTQNSEMKGTKCKPSARLPAHGRLLGCVVIIIRMRTAN